MNQFAVLYGEQFTGVTARNPPLVQNFGEVRQNFRPASPRPSVPQNRERPAERGVLVTLASSSVLTRTVALGFLLLESHQAGDAAPGTCLGSAVPVADENRDMPGLEFGYDWRSVLSCRPSGSVRDLPSSAVIECKPVQELE